MKHVIKPALSIATLIALSALITSAPARAGVSGFVLVNGTDARLSAVAIRRVGTDGWQPLGASPSAGASQAIKFSDRDCAFDIRAQSGGKPVTWAGINLCDVKSVTLKSDSAGSWVDYDAP
ncbi:MAG: hypothetical protein ABIR63_01980 [Sphingomicrobium sp.]